MMRFWLRLSATLTRCPQVLCGDEFDDEDSKLQPIRSVFLRCLGPNAMAIVSDGYKVRPDSRQS
jgi:hypothetical protein